MRTAALPHFRKLYGRIVPNGGFTGFKTGDRIGIRVIPNFLVESFQGSKALGTLFRFYRKIYTCIT